MGFFVLQVPSDRTARRSGKALNHLQPDGCGLRNNWHADSRGPDGNRVAPSLCYCRTKNVSYIVEGSDMSQHFCALLKTLRVKTRYDCPQSSIKHLFNLFMLSAVCKGRSAALLGERKDCDGVE